MATDVVWARCYAHLGFLRALTTSSVLKAGAVPVVLREEVNALRQMALSVSNLVKKELRSLGRNAGL